MCKTYTFYIRMPIWLWWMFIIGGVILLGHHFSHQIAHLWNS